MTARVHKLLNKRKYPNPVPRAMVKQLESHINQLFGGYRLVVIHGDLVPNNILVDPETFAITGIIDWSHAAVHPFGMDMYAMFLALGYVDETGWHYYNCRARLQEAFWAELFTVSGIHPSARQSVLQKLESAGALGAALRFAFRPNADGSASPVNEQSVYLKGWYPDFYEMGADEPGNFVRRGIRRLLRG